MTFAILGSPFAPEARGKLDAAAPLAVHTDREAIDLNRLFRLDRLPDRPQLVCRWHRDSDGRLTCLWEPDIVVIPQR
jgi:hypothetical protein